MVDLKVDGREVSVPEGANLVEAVEAAGAYVPRLCWEPGLEADGACGLCVVGLEGTERTVLACETPADIAPFDPAQFMEAMFTAE